MAKSAEVFIRKYSHFFFGFLHSNGNGVPVRAPWALSFGSKTEDRKGLTV